MVQPVVTCEGLTKDYGEGRGVFDLDLNVERGEVFGYLGPNGAGKSTTIRMLLDLARPTAGAATVLGESPVGNPSVRERITYLPGELRLWSDLSVGRTISHLLRLRAASVPQQAVTDLYERLDLDPTRRVSELSKGNKQKVGLVAAFAPDAELMILDEPTSGLDPLLQKEFLQLVREKAAEGTTVLLSSHVLSEVESIADRIAILQQGHLVALMSVEQMRAEARPVIEIAFGAAVPAGFGDGLDGVEVLASDRPQLFRARMSGSFDALVKSAAQHEVVSIRTDDYGLEEAFLAYYSAQPATTETENAEVQR